MNSGLKVTIDLIPDVSKDLETGLFVAKFPDLPQITAFDDTEEKAIYRLLTIFEVFVKEQKEIVFERVIKKHLEKALSEKASFNIMRIQDLNNVSKEKMKLQMVS